MDLSPTCDYYRRKLEQYGATAAGMDWKDQTSQTLRFDRLTRFLPPHQVSSLLDVGCGNGALATFLATRFPEVNVFGIDICPEMVAVCLATHGEGTARVTTCDELLREGSRFDYIVASGVFNVKLDASDLVWRDYTLHTIGEMFELANICVAFNLMSPFVDYRYDRLFYPMPGDIEAFVANHVTRKYFIDHAYPLFETTYTLFRTPELRR